MYRDECTVIFRYREIAQKLANEVEYFVGYLLKKSKKKMTNFDFKAEEVANQEAKSQKIFEIMQEIASRPNSFTGIDGVEWQKGQRQDRPMPFRD